MAFDVGASGLLSVAIKIIGEGLGLCGPADTPAVAAPLAQPAVAAQPAPPAPPPADDALPSALLRPSSERMLLEGETTNAAIRVQRVQRGKASRSAMRAGALAMHRIGVEEAAEAKEEATLKAADVVRTTAVAKETAGKRFAQMAAEEQAAGFAAAITIDETGSVTVEITLESLHAMGVQGGATEVKAAAAPAVPVAQANAEEGAAEEAKAVPLIAVAEVAASVAPLGTLAAGTGTDEIGSDLVRVKCAPRGSLVRVNISPSSTAIVNKELEAPEVRVTEKESGAATG